SPACQVQPDLRRRERFFLGREGRIGELSQPIKTMKPSSEQPMEWFHTGSQGDFKNRRKSRSRRGNEAELFFAPKSASLRRRLPSLHTLDADQPYSSIGSAGRLRIARICRTFRCGAPRRGRGELRHLFPHRQVGREIFLL